MLSIPERPGHRVDGRAAPGLMLEIREHAENLIRQRDVAVEIMERLANPQ